ncbi:tRNA modification GTPase [Rhodoligotrophos appendicifer]|uniref:tRNA uridine-5-carboxymethylaminomethyl(34) synthesis GTPase MnmE n=1 Tax=Rhodoligotrophos appendicifer TaxID=987056 RepID=UPI001FE3637D|nr:tRNA uridine-5-carboxymethylaminomethyl(34) synthesis GTPase MnmE [Rhodoligotrophos appendicifer]
MNPDRAVNRTVDTIFAPSSGAGRAAIAVVRLTGPECKTVCIRICGDVPPPRRASLRRIRNPDTSVVIDQALVLWLPGPSTFSGEDMLELHLHGGPAVVAAVLRTLTSQPGLRPAEAGEFSRRALDNGRMSLVDLEGLSDLIAAETEGQRLQALRQSSGELDRVFEGWRARALGLLGHLEAHIDFVDEEGVPDEVAAEVRRRAGELARDITGYLGDGRGGERLREGFTIVLAGPPNVGKSSLMNRIAKRDVAIVANRPGTTRDVLEVHLDLNGYPVILIDTAGIRDAETDEVEAEGMRRARDRMARADLTLWVESPDVALPPLPPFDSPVIRLANKADLFGHTVDDTVIPVSARTGEGLDRLLEVMGAWVSDSLSRALQEPLVTRERHRHALQACIAALARAEQGMVPELIGEDLRAACLSLGRVVGRIDVEDVLGAIFAEFCIGK